MWLRCYTIYIININGVLTKYGRLNSYVAAINVYCLVFSTGKNYNYKCKLMLTSVPVGHGQLLVVMVEEEEGDHPFWVVHLLGFLRSFFGAASYV